MKIIQFVDENIPFVRDSYHRAIKDLSLIDSSIEIKSYTYYDLKKENIIGTKEELILFLEAGQLQPQHSGWNLLDFKGIYPNSKIIVWSSDFPYYWVNFKQFQFENADQVDFVFECTANYNQLWGSIGVKSVSIPWTISRHLYERLRECRGPYLNLTQKINDLICLANFSGEYRKNLLQSLQSKNISLQVGGNHQDNNLQQTYINFINSWIAIGTSSHNRPELNEMGNRTGKGYRDALAIALNCLLIYDDDPEVDKIWDLPIPRFDFYNAANEIQIILEYYKESPQFYETCLKKQQQWLENHLLDDMIYQNLKQYGIL